MVCGSDAWARFAQASDDPRRVKERGQGPSSGPQMEPGMSSYHTWEDVDWACLPTTEPMDIIITYGGGGGRSVGGEGRRSDYT